MLVLGATFALVRPAHAQVNDFATCSTGSVTSSFCSATKTGCCKQSAGVASTFLKSATDYAIVIPLDYCHQAGTTASLATAPTWCANRTSGGGMFTAYGLVFRLMQAGIPVYWIVNPSKDPPALGSTNGASVEITTDIDMWVLSSATTTPPATFGTALTACSGACVPPVKHWKATSAGGFAVDGAYTYGYKEFPIRGSAFLIAAADRANFNKFMTRQAPYASWAANPVRSCGNGTSCQDFSSIDYFEIQPTARLAWTDFSIALPYPNGARVDEVPIAATLNTPPPKIARIGPGGVAQGWLGNANLEDPSSGGCKNGAMNPSDSTVCDVGETDITGGNLVSNAFGWLWMDHQQLACTTMPFVRTFATRVPNVRTAGNVMVIADGIYDETCANYQLLGKEAAGTGLTSANGNSGSAYILRYPQSLFMQWGDAAPDFSNGEAGTGFTYFGGSANGYNPLFTGASNTLHRLTTIDNAAGTNTLCSQQKSSVFCDVTGTGNGDNTDVAAYGRLDNSAGNGIIYYLVGTQIQNHGSELRMLLDSLIATPLGTVPATGTTIEVSRAAPVVATISNVPAVVHGSYEYTTPVTAPTTFSLDSDAGGFTFPYQKGHLRAIAASALTTSASSFTSTTPIFDAGGSNMIPPVTLGGCGTNFAGSCRTVFTTTATTRSVGIGLPKVFVNDAAATVTVLGPIMGSNLNVAHQGLLIDRVLKGYPASGGTYVAALGGVDRSTVAVIESSSLAGSARPKMAYFGATDGMLHAVCASVSGPCDVLGRELWAYIPRVNLPNLRYNTARIDGSPRVADVYGDFYGTGTKSFRTILMFQTGTGDPTSDAKAPAVYALDITNPASPNVLWEYKLASAAARGAYELGVGLTLAQGTVGTNRVVFAQTNNGGTGGPANVVTAIDEETGLQFWTAPWSNSYSPLRVGGDLAIAATGIPGGAVAVDKTGNGTVTDLVFADLYGNLWEVDPATGANRYAHALFSFSTDYHPIGAKPAIYSNGNLQYALIVSGGYVDPSDTTWDGGVTQYAVAVALNTPTGVVAGAPLDETSSATYVPIKITLGAGERGFSQATIVGTELFLTTDTADVNATGYGTGGATGHMYRYNFASGTPGTTVVLAGGASSVVNNGTDLYTSSSDSQQQLGTGAASTTGANVSGIQIAKVTRKLWLRTQ